IEIERAMRVVSAVSVVSVKCIVLLVGGPLLLVGGPGHLLTRLGAQVFDAVRRRIEEILARPIEIGRTGSSCLFGSACRVLPIVRRERRRRRRSWLAPRIAARELRARPALPDQARELGKRIVGLAAQPAFLRSPS